MTDPLHTPQALHVVPLHSALPIRLVSNEVQVRGALSHLPELRSAVRVCEWMVEPTAHTREVSLTLVLSENVSLSFLLAAEDAQDLGFTLAQTEPGAGAP